MYAGVCSVLLTALFLCLNYDIFTVYICDLQYIATLTPSYVVCDVVA